MNILLQPSSGKQAMEHYEDTIGSGVDISFLKDYVSDVEYQKLKELGTSKVKVWGFVSASEDKPRSEWTNLNEGDIVLFYAKKQFYYIAKVYSKIHNKELAKVLWGIDKEGRAWEYIYFIEEGKQIQVPYKPQILTTTRGIPYKKNHIVQGAILLNQENTDNLKSYLEGIEGDLIDESNIEPSSDEETYILSKLKQPTSSEEAEVEINKISSESVNKPVKEKIKLAKTLSRNSKYARLVKEKQRYICEICGSKPFIQKNGLPYAEAHHKFELSKTRIDNPHFMICVCAQCHRIIHFGNDESLEERKRMVN
tara:strand:+ start:177 stop:1106 length:930 start_codon:yes stop_codon:yes gene_type:complete